MGIPKAQVGRVRHGSRLRSRQFKHAFALATTLCVAAGVVGVRSIKASYRVANVTYDLTDSVQRLSALWESGISTVQTQAVRAVLSPAARHAFDSLRSARYFAPDYVGAQGWLDENVRSFQVLLDDPRAAGAFELLAASKGARRLYGLAGFFFTNRSAYWRLSRQLWNNNEHVTMIHFSDRYRVRVSELIDRRSRGETFVVCSTPSSSRDEQLRALLRAEELSLFDLLERGLRRNEIATSFDFASGHVPIRLLRAGSDPFGDFQSVHEIRRRFDPKRRNDGGSFWHSGESGWNWLASKVRRELTIRAEEAIGDIEAGVQVSVKLGQDHRAVCAESREFIRRNSSHKGSVPGLRRLADLTHAGLLNGIDFVLSKSVFEHPVH